MRRKKQETWFEQTDEYGTCYWPGYKEKEVVYAVGWLILFYTKQDPVGFLDAKTFLCLPFLDYGK